MSFFGDLISPIEHKVEIYTFDEAKTKIQDKLDKGYEIVNMTSNNSLVLIVFKRE